MCRKDFCIESRESVPHSAAKNNNGSPRRISENQGLRDRVQAAQVILTAGEMRRCPPTFDGCGLPLGT